MMKSERELICIVCPVGCHLSVGKDGEDGWQVSGNQCPRGKVYGIKEMTNPTRVLPTTVTINNGLLHRLPVKSSEPIPKNLLFEAMTVINQVRIEAPVKRGDVVVKNILDTGVDIVATRSMAKKEEVIQ